ncbi:MAG: hypothetical protein NZM02_02700 [Patescibacteria group bacterium]|nr:hypothetical protein [Patescibacteria group bacterium]
MKKQDLHLDKQGGLLSLGQELLRIPDGNITPEELEKSILEEIDYFGLNQEPENNDPLLAKVKPKIKEEVFSDVLNHLKSEPDISPPPEPIQQAASSNEMGTNK